MLQRIKTLLPRPKTAEPQPHAEGVRETPVRQRHQPIFGRTVGCYLTPETVYLAVVRHIGKKRSIVAAEAHPLPDGASTEDLASLTANLIRESLAARGLTGARITVAVAGQGTAFRVFGLPAMSRTDLASAVHIEAARQIPFPPADCHYAFTPIARLSSGSQTRLKIALYAATKTLIRQSITPLEKAGTLPRAIHSTPVIIGRLLSELPNFDPARAYTVLRIGRHDAETAFYRGDTLDFFHLGATGSSMLGDANEPAHLEYFTETLASDIQTSFDYYSGQHSTSLSPEILVYGEASTNNAMLELLSERTGYRFAPFPIHQIQGATIAPSASPAIVLEGLPAVASALSRSSNINLLAADRRRYWQYRRIDLYGKVALAALLALMVLGWAMINRDFQTHQKTSLALQRQLAMFQASEAYHEFNILKARMTASSQFVRLAAKEPTWLALNLKELSRLTPADIQLLRYELSTAEPGQNLRIQGVAYAPANPPEVALAEFVERLNASGFFENVDVERHVKRQVDNQFVIDFQLLMRGLL